MVTTPTYDEVTAVYEGGDPVATGDLTQDQADQAIDEAVSMFEGLFEDLVLFESQTVDEDVAVRLLARHKLDLALGNTVESEGQAGNTVTYVSKQNQRSLERTTPGQEFLEYLTETPNIGVVRSR